MTTFSRRTTLAAAAAALGLAALPLAATAQDAGVSGPVLLTVTGNIATPNRTGSGEDDKFFGYQDVAFDVAAQFDYAKLQGLALHQVKADFPKGGPVHTFEGPLLADVLHAAGATGKMVTVQALDGYQVEAPLEDLVAMGAVVALSRNGQPFAIGDYGPTQIVFPRAERADLAAMNDDNWVWSIFHIKVE